MQEFFQNRTKLIRTVFIIAVLAFSWPKSGMAQDISVGVYDNKPLIYADKSGQGQGATIDILREVAKQEGWNLKYIPCGWKTCLENLSSGTADIQPAIIATSKRHETMDFSNEPAVTLWGQLYTRKGEGFNSVLDMDGKKVGVYDGSIPAKEIVKLAEGFGLNVKFVGKADYADLAKLLADGEIDAALFIRTFAVHYQGKEVFEKTPIVLSPFHLTYAVNKGKNSPLLQSIDKHLGAWRLDKKSVYYDVIEKHLPSQKQSN